ncbi:MAG: TlpA disulfide reductase family protein [Bacteroidota bacterium]|nr:TlpA disulfide reductase family protein [Bacteroidota bacterium]
MISYIRVLFLLISISTSSYGSVCVTISGTFTGMNRSNYLYINYVDFDQVKTIPFDSIFCKERLPFSKQICLESASILWISYMNAPLCTLAVEDKETIDLKITPTVVEVTGCKGSEMILNYEKYRKKSYAKYVEPINIQIDEANKNDDKLRLIQLQNDHVLRYAKHRADLTEYTRYNMFNHIAAYVSCLRWNGDNDIPFVDSLVKNLKNKYPNNYWVNSLDNRLKALKKTAIGQPAPEIELFNPEGKKVNLKSMKGKYILVDFWASWCSPCRMESATLVKMYEQYKPVNFEIFSVSIDTEKSNWMNSIISDKYNWTNVSDLKGWKSPAMFDYGVTYIPANFLVDPNGIIIKKNIRGSALVDTLSELFSKY